MLMIHRPSSAIFIVALVLVESAALGGVRCDDDWPSWIQTASDEAGWRANAYYFLNYDNCDNPYPPAYTPASRTPVYDQTEANRTASYWLDNANKLYLSGYYEQAAASYAKAVGLDRSLTEGWMNMANSLYFLGRYKDSLDAYNAVIALDPLNANAIIGKGKALMAMNRTQKANETLNVTKI